MAKHIRKVKGIITILFIGLFSISAKLGDSGNYDTNAKIKAVYLYNFTKYVEWPKEYRTEDFVFGVLGDTPLVTELKKMSASKKVLGKPISVKQFKSVSEMDKCHILFVSNKSKTDLSTIAGKIANHSTLLVTDNPGMAQKGAAINFVIRQNRQKFELNKSNAEKYKLKVSNSLEALAIIVN